MALIELVVMSKPLIVYIAGYGRSGSTALDVALGATCRNAVSLGEAIGLPRSVAGRRIGCSCGEAYEECNVWGACLRQSETGKQQWLTVSRCDGLLPVNAHARAAYSTFWQNVLETRLNGRKSEVAEHEPVQRGIGIDSSKTTVCTAKRPKNLVEFGVADVFVVHVRRSLRGVLASRRKGRNVELVSNKGMAALSAREKWFGLIWYLVVPLHIIFANLVAKGMKRYKGGAGYAKVEFDQIVRNPEAVALEIWEQVKAATGREVMISSPRSNRVRADHFIEGNRLLQRDGGVRIRPDESIVKNG